MKLFYLFKGLIFMHERKCHVIALLCCLDALRVLNVRALYSSWLRAILIKFEIVLKASYNCEDSFAYCQSKIWHHYSTKMLFQNYWFEVYLSYMKNFFRFNSNVMWCIYYHGNTGNEVFSPYTVIFKEAKEIYEPKKLAWSNDIHLLFAARKKRLPAKLYIHKLLEKKI